MYYQPTPITWNNYHFLIMSAPDNDSMNKCIKVSHHYILIIIICEGPKDKQGQDVGEDMRKNI